MARIAQARSRALQIPVVLLSFLFPTIAHAGWGDENWGSMVWGGSPIVDIPALPVDGVISLAVLLLGLSYWLLAVRRRSAKRSPLNS